MDIAVSLPLDGDGFLRRQCPACTRVFKWHHGPVDGAPEDGAAGDEYFCPYCGEAAAPDQWYTDEQVEYLQSVAAAEVLPVLREGLQKAIAPLNKSGFLRAEVSGGDVDYPSPLTETDDLMIVASPCHTYEPVKIVEDWNAPVHCLVCGQLYVLPDRS